MWQRSKEQIWVQVQYPSESLRNEILSLENLWRDRIAQAQYKSISNALHDVLPDDVVCRIAYFAGCRRRATDVHVNNGCFFVCLGCETLE